MRFSVDRGSGGGGGGGGVTQVTGGGGVDYSGGVSSASWDFGPVDEANNISMSNKTSTEIRIEVGKDGRLAWVVGVGVLLSVFILAAIAGNVLVIVAIVTERNLRRAGNNFLVSLAVADTLVACVVMTFAAANDLTNRWSFGAVFCDIWQSADVMCCTASILHICAVSLDRYINIRDPLRYRNLVTHRRSLIAVALIWTVSVLMSFIPIHLGWHRFQQSGDADSKRLPVSLPLVGDVVFNVTLTPDANTDAYTVRSNFSEELEKGILGNDLEQLADTDGVCVLDLNPWYACVSSVISFYIPCTVMIVIYIRLFRLSQKHRKFISRSVSGNGDLQRRRSTSAGLFGSQQEFPHQNQALGPRDRLPGDDPSEGVLLPTRRSISDSAGDRFNNRRTQTGCFYFQPAPVVASLRRSSLLDRFNPPTASRRCSAASGDTGCPERPWGHNSLGVTPSGYRRTLSSSSRRPSDFRFAGNYIRERRRSVSVEQFNRLATDYKAAMTVGCIIGIFLFCWGPFFVVNIVGSVWHESISPVVYTVFTWLGYVNSCANPIIYGVTNVEFRRAFFRILAMLCCNCRYFGRRAAAAAAAAHSTPSWCDNNNYHEGMMTVNESRFTVDDLH